MNLALQLETRSTCQRKQVGCVITSSDSQHIYGIGYNGSAPGESNSCERPSEAGNCGCEHAESNALLKVAEPSFVPKILFTTWSPCLSCTKKILIKKGIEKVYYFRAYRDKASLDLLNKYGIETVYLGKE
jgi:deoxycytidylate deaminase